MKTFTTVLIWCLLLLGALSLGRIVMRVMIAFWLAITIGTAGAVAAAMQEVKGKVKSVTIEGSQVA